MRNKIEIKKTKDHEPSYVFWVDGMMPVQGHNSTRKAAFEAAKKASKSMRRRKTK